MFQGQFKIESNRTLAPDVHELVLAGPAAECLPGQFVEISVPGFFLRRPFALVRSGAGSFTILFKVVGKGTAALAAMQAGDTLDAIGGLGNSFLTKEVQRPLLVAGGMGVAPIYALADAFAKRGVKSTVVLAANTAADIAYATELETLGAKVLIATMDGSAGAKGFATDALAAANPDFECFYACGPLPMMRALSLALGTPGQVSMEARMGCGVGLCMGCTIETNKGAVRVCKEGPVFDKEDIIWAE